MEENLLQQPEIWTQIPLDKKDNILKASIEEFAQYGYTQASTNRIIKSAGISKGLLFHYFGNKKTLFLSIFELILNQFLEYYHQNIDKQPADLFDRISQWSKKKLQLFFDYPLESKILMDTLLDLPEELNEELGKLYENLSKNSIQLFLQDIDYSRFRLDIQPQKAIGLIMTVMDTLSNQYIKLYKQEGKMDQEKIRQAFDEVDEYLYMLKVGLYPQN